MCTLGILLQTHDLMTAIRPYVSKMLQSTLMFWSKKFGVIIADAAKFHGQYADVTQSSSRTESTELLKYFKNMQVNVTGEQKWLQRANITVDLFMMLNNTITSQLAKFLHPHVTFCAMYYSVASKQCCRVIHQVHGIWQNWDDKTLPEVTYVNGGGDSLWKWLNFRLSRARNLELDLGSGHTAHRHASLIDLYVHTIFHWNRRNFLWTDGRTDGHLRPTLLGRLGGVDLNIWCTWLYHSLRDDGPWVTMRFQLQLPVPGTLCCLSSEINSHWRPYDGNWRQFFSGYPLVRMLIPEPRHC